MTDDQDINTKLAQIMRKAIDAFGRANRCSPANVVVYRDGVSQGQI